MQNGFRAAANVFRQASRPITIRVKPENLQRALRAIPGSREVKAPIYDIEREYRSDWGDYSDPHSSRMKGLQLPQGMSAMQAHRLLVDADVVVNCRCKDCRKRGLA